MGECRSWGPEKKVNYNGTVWRLRAGHGDTFPTCDSLFQFQTTQGMPRRPLNFNGGFSTLTVYFIYIHF
ncbi:hypothetical protein TSUD_311590 [Trifolium subterraneum]|uniref:Uncharacterized protein n=1 Tax=Trifolium subterraneum TaxID=3900 RepID=A0A2Z6LY81_TRISU|nr:hypothetical protein TSUD_311590 [Trifolium subterraneum]